MLKKTALGGPPGALRGPLRLAATRLEVSVALRVTNAGALINALARPISYTWYVFYRTTAVPGILERRTFYHET